MMMSHESPSRVPSRCCTTCFGPNAHFRCLDCPPPRMMCQPCLVAAHQAGIPHRIQVGTPLPPMNNTHGAHSLGCRDGPELSLPQNPFPTSVLYTNSAIALANAAKYHQSRPSSLFSISPVFTLSASPTASVARPVPPFFVVLNSRICSGFLQRGTNRVLRLPSGCLITFISSKREARSACMTYMTPSSLSKTLPA